MIRDFKAVFQNYQNHFRWIILFVKQVVDMKWKFHISKKKKKTFFYAVIV